MKKCPTAPVTQNNVLDLKMSRKCHACNEKRTQVKKRARRTGKETFGREISQLPVRAGLPSNTEGHGTFVYCKVQPHLPDTPTRTLNRNQALTTTKSYWSYVHQLS